VQKLGVRGAWTSTRYAAKNVVSLDIGLPAGKLRDGPLNSTSAAKTKEQRLHARDRRGRDIVCRVMTAALADISGAVAGRS